jgi:hypothetical protein
MCSILETYLTSSILDSPPPPAEDTLDVVMLLTDFCQDLRKLLLAIMSQITKRLLRKDRLLRLQQEFKTDSVLWSTLLQKLHHTVLGGPDDALVTVGGGLLMHVRYVLKDYWEKSKDAAGTVVSAATGTVVSAASTGRGAGLPSSGREKLRAYIDEFCKTSLECNRLAVMGHMEVLARALGDMATDLGGPEQQDQIVREYRVLRRDGLTRQFNVYVKNLEGLYDIVRAVVDSANDYSHDIGVSNRATTRTHAAVQQLLGPSIDLDLVREVLESYMEFWSALMSVMKKYLLDLTLDFRLWEREQFLEFQDGAPCLSSRGFSRLTLESLGVILENSNLTKEYVLVLHRMVELQAQEPKEGLQWTSKQWQRQSLAETRQELLLHIVKMLCEQGRIDPEAVTELLTSESIVRNDSEQTMVPVEHTVKDLEGSALERHRQRELYFGFRRLCFDQLWPVQHRTSCNVCKHFIELPDEVYPVAIKWIQVCNTQDFKVACYILYHLGQNLVGEIP